MLKRAHPDNCKSRHTLYPKTYSAELSLWVLPYEDGEVSVWSEIQLKFTPRSEIESRATEDICHEVRDGKKQESVDLYLEFIKDYFQNPAEPELYQLGLKLIEAFCDGFGAAEDRWEIFGAMQSYNDYSLINALVRFLEYGTPRHISRYLVVLTNTFACGYDNFDNVIFHLARNWKIHMLWDNIAAQRDLLSVEPAAYYVLAHELHRQNVDKDAPLAWYSKPWKAYTEERVHEIRYENEETQN